MLTGRRAFEGGETISDSVATILKSEPAWPALPIDTPPHISTLLRRCLRKDPQRRLQAIGDARLAMEEGPAEPPAFSGPAAVPAVVVRRGRAAWIVAAIALVAAAAFVVPALRHMRESVAAPIQARFEVPTPPTSDSGSFALSLDGRQLAFVATAEGTPRLWVRSLDEVTPRVLPGTDGAAYPFWEPDARAIGFFAGGKLKRVDPAGGTPQPLADAPSARGGTWNRDGVIVFAPSAELAVSTSVLMRVAAGGGAATPVTRLAAGHGSHRWPQFLPDGRRFMFFVRSEKPEIEGAYLGSLDGGEATRIMASSAAVLFAPPNFLLDVRQDTLFAVRFDAARGTLSGEPVPVAHGVGADTGVFRGAFSVSAAGVLAHRAVSGSQRRQLQWVSRTGTRLGTVPSPDENGLASPELAPDEQRVAVIRSAGGAPAVWLIEVGRGVPSRFTFDATVYQNPVWSPDGRRVAFSSTRNGFHDLFEKASDGVGDERPLFVTAESKGLAGWSHDAKFLLYGSQDPTTGVDLWAVPLDGDRKPFPVVQTPIEDAAGQFSPDGRFVAYQSNKSGAMEIYVQPFPGGGAAHQISTAGGGQPRWRPDGRELFYVAPDTRLMAVLIALGKDGQTIEPGTPEPLFLTRLASGANIVSGTLLNAQYAVARDGRFLLNATVDEATPSPITVVLNWDAVLKK
jgi:Tol biopolymer transport system component